MAPPHTVARLTIIGCILCSIHSTLAVSASFDSHDRPTLTGASAPGTAAGAGGAVAGAGTLMRVASLAVEADGRVADFSMGQPTLTVPPPLTQTVLHDDVVGSQQSARGARSADAVDSLIGAADAAEARDQGATPAAEPPTTIAAAKQAILAASEEQWFVEGGYPAADECRLFAEVAVDPNAGVGHRVMDLALTAQFAAALNATPVFDFVGFTGSGLHGEYAWLPAFLGLQRSPFLPLQRLHLQHVVRVQSWGTVGAPVDLSDRSAEARCNMLVRSCDRCCGMPHDPLWCTSTEAGALAAMTPAARSWFAATPWGAAARQWVPAGFEAAPRTLYVGLHLRIGDIRPACKDTQFWHTVRGVLDRLVKQSPVPVQFIIYSERMWPVECISPPYVPGTIERMSFNVLDHLLDWLGLDVLISNGSSMPFIVDAISPYVTHLSGLTKDANIGMYGTGTTEWTPEVAFHVQATVCRALQRAFNRRLWTLPLPPQCDGQQLF